MHPYLNNGPGQETIEPLLLTGEACISVVTLAEVISKLCVWGMSCETAREVFDKLTLKPRDCELSQKHTVYRWVMAQPGRCQALELTISTFRSAAH